MKCQDQVANHILPMLFLYQSVEMTQYYVVVVGVWVVFGCERSTYELLMIKYSNALGLGTHRASHKGILVFYFTK